MIFEVKNEQEMKQIGERIGAKLCGGEIIELVGDVGSGKTTLAKGIAVGLGVTENVQSPSFTISRLYNCRNSLLLAHYDFYRLNDAGIMLDEISESIKDPRTITLIEWGDVVEAILPKSKITIKIISLSESTRRLDIVGQEKITEALV